MKIVILDASALNPGDMSWDLIRAFSEVTIYPRTVGKDEIVRRIGDAEIVLLNKVPIDEEILCACPSVKLICCLSTGYNVVDINAARDRGIPVCNVPAYSTAAVSQFTFALLLELCHRVGHHDKTVHDGKWAVCPDFCYWDTPQMELADKTMGIIGFGRIGQAVGRIAKAMGMEVLAYSRSRRPEGEAIATYVDLDTLLSSSDIISLHCPLFPETENLINADAIKKMKDGAILLNTSRGQVIDEAAVAEALKSGKLRGAAMDVVSEEPISPANPLLSAPNCIITPHMAWAPMETRQRILDITAQNIAGFLSGAPQNVINP
ncbi:MAG: D-2-hydroxyacid dehydrogenase [Oscillospiraceae bacterium]|nr:D-2-hydroxyacid dehydrogenase [Oscillospiraceae bacterium]